jgi:hypothetical protein
MAIDRVVVIVHMHGRATVRPAAPVTAPVIRVTVVAVVEHVDAIRHPAKRVSRGYAPEETAIERVIERVMIWIRVVVDRVGPRIIVVDRAWLVNDHALGFVVGHIDYVVFDRRDFDCPLIVRNGLV